MRGFEPFKISQRQWSTVSVQSNCDFIVALDVLGWCLSVVLLEHTKANPRHTGTRSCTVPEMLHDATTGLSRTRCMFDQKDNSEDMRLPLEPRP
jgi:hypothetical protein